MDGNRKTPAAAWWDYVTGPSRLVAEVAALLHAGKSVFLSAHIPFCDTFFGKVAAAFRAMDNALLFDDVIDTEEDPGTHLLERFNVRVSYRSHDTSAECLKRSGVLKNRLLPVIVGRERTDSWIEFIRSYKSSTLRDGLFLLKTDDGVSATSVKQLRVPDYHKFVSEYDSLLFAGLISDESALSVGERRYVSALSVSLFGKNAEGIADFIDKYKIDRCPLDVLPQGAFSGEEWTYKLWNAQVQELFPLIMRETREFIETWRIPIDEAFKSIREERDYPNSLFSQGLLNTYKEPITSPDDLELATIIFLMRNKRRNSSGYETPEFLLYIPDESARERIKLLYEMRNSIAHGKICPENDVVRLLRWRQ
ncbi:MAG: hypothetical protein LBB74_01715 [Chitinispirillales bacterium]|jgi:hypothetical protein|nr:hypothetical protein [Chitinispirillales bacterium]